MFFREPNRRDTDIQDVSELSEEIVNRSYRFISLSVRDTVLELKAYCFILYLVTSPGVILTIMIDYLGYCFPVNR